MKRTHSFMTLLSTTLVISLTALAMSANADDVKINFQVSDPGDAGLPAGYLLDLGDSFADRGNGYDYGWNTGNTANARDRDNIASPDERFDTFVHLQNGAAGTIFDWRIDLDNGVYNVVGVFGEPSFGSTNNASIEGSTFVDPSPGAAPNWDAYHAVVNLTDSTLNVSQTGTDNSAKFTYVEILASSDNVSVDYGVIGSTTNVQTGYISVENTAAGGDTTRTIAADFGQGNGDTTFDAALTANGTMVGFRDRNVVGGIFDSESFLLSDLAKANNDANSSDLDSLVLTLSDLAAGEYELTTFHHDSSFDQGTIDILVDGIEVVSNLDQSTGTSPSLVASATFMFFADGVNPVEVEFRTDIGTLEAVLNGFQLTAVPEPGALGLAALGLLGAALLVRRRRRV